MQLRLFKKYRCIKIPIAGEAFPYGTWEIEYKGKWHLVKNLNIRRQLATEAGYYTEQK